MLAQLGKRGKAVPVRQAERPPAYLSPKTEAFPQLPRRPTAFCAEIDAVLELLALEDNLSGVPEVKRCVALARA